MVGDCNILRQQQMNFATVREQCTHLEDFRVRHHCRVRPSYVKVTLVELSEAAFSHLGLVSPVHLGYVIPLHVGDGVLSHIPRKWYGQVIPTWVFSQSQLACMMLLGSKACNVMACLPILEARDDALAACNETQSA